MKRLMLCLALVLAPLAMAQTAEEILDKSAKAAGDLDEIAKITSVTTTGSIFLPQGIQGKVEILNKDPKKVKMTMDVEAPGMKMQTVMGCDGVDCYSNDPMMGLRKLEGAEKEAMLIQNDLRSQIQWRNMYMEPKLEGKETLPDGREAFKISMQTKAGMPVTNYYSTKDYTLLRSDMVNKGPMGEIKTETYMEDYKKFSGIIYLPSVMRTKMMGNMEMRMIIEDMDVKTPLPDSLFKLPPGLEE
jgi:hypothetical protein